MILLIVFFMLLGIAYPMFCMFVLYPIYRKNGGKMSLKRYMKHI